MGEYMGTHPIFESDFDCLTENGLQKHSAAMFMDRKVRDKIYTTLFQDGVMVAEKIRKRNAGRMHNDVKDVPNLKQQFAWRHFYWVLTNEGVEYLREYLNLPAEIVPQTMKKAPKIVDDRPRGGGRVGLPTQAYSQDNRDAYRREKDANVGAGEGNFSFRGAGRGKQ